MSRRMIFGFSLVVPMLSAACAREQVSLGADDAGSGQAGSDQAPAGTGGTASADGGRGQGTEAGSGNPQPTAECVVAGCPSEHCVEASDTSVDTCEWLEEYACYRTATCEPQANGQCGWTQTAKLDRCIKAARQGGNGGAGPSVAEGGSPAAGGTGGRLDATGGKVGHAGGTASVTAGAGGEADCYSPERNLDRAYDGTMEGCACSGDASICLSGVALMCYEGRWDAVEDGPCEPRELNCTGEVETAEQCLELFNVCISLNTGGYCGITSATTQCEQGRIVPSPAQCLDVGAPSFCHVLDNGSWCTGLQRASCPDGWLLTAQVCASGVSWCIRDSEPLACVLGQWEASECQAAGGTVRSDPGDGSFMEAGCPEGEIELAMVNNCEEGCLCCNAAADRRIGIREAHALIYDWAFRDSPDLNPAVSIDVEEYDVPGLWETLRVQLFYAEYVSSDGQRSNADILAYYEGTLYPFGSTFGGDGLMSGVLRGEAFYYTYGWGSGIYRSVIGKLTIENAEPQFLENGGFRDRNMMLKLVDGELQVEEGGYVDFNEWSMPEPVGTLVDQDGELTVLDSEGVEIVPGLLGEP